MSIAPLQPGAAQVVTQAQQLVQQAPGQLQEFEQVLAQLEQQGKDPAGSVQKDA